MGLSNRVMAVDEAVKIAETVAKAKAKYGRHGQASLHSYDIEQALCVLLADRSAADKLAEELRSYEITVENRELEIAELKAENTKLKQRISGYETAAKRRGGENS